MDLLIDLHKEGPRQGPGDEKYTKLAMDLAGLTDSNGRFKILDVGSGTGASTMVLASYLNADIIAVDFCSDFLSVLNDKTQSCGQQEKISVLNCSMDDLPFFANSFDVIWGEGSIYIMGFKNGINYLNRYLKPGGKLALSEITWLTPNRPDEINTFWQNEYPEIATASEKIKILEEHGFNLKGYFPLPKSAWLDNYYLPLQGRFDAFLARHNTNEARELIEGEIKEIKLYEKYCDFYSYGFYIAQKAL